MTNHPITSPEIKSLLENSYLYASQKGNPSLNIEHVIKNLLDINLTGITLVTSLLQSLSIDHRKITLELEKYCSSTGNPGVILPLNSVMMSLNVSKSLISLNLEAQKFSCVSPEPIHWLLSCLKEKCKPIQDLQKLPEFQLFNYDDISEKYEELLSLQESGEDEASAVEGTPFFGMGTDDVIEGEEEPTKQEEVKKTPALDRFSINLSDLAKNGKLDPVIGRFREIERVVQILSRKKKNNPVLLGEPGVGKTAIAEGLALRILSNEVPPILEGKTVVSLDLVGIVAGTKFRGEFEERIKAVLQELKDNRNIIMFIDELHTIVGAGNSSGQMDAANILKPALAREEIQCIGATTLKEYRESIEKDGALSRRFQKVRVEPTSILETTKILENLQTTYGDHHKVIYTKESIEACVSMSVRYINDRFLPDKAIDLLDEAGARVNIKNRKSSNKLEELTNSINEEVKLKELAVENQEFEQAAKHRQKEVILKKQKEDLLKEENDFRNKNRIKVTGEDVANVISTMTGIPVTKISAVENSKLKKLPKILKEKVIGQDEAVDKVVKSIQRSRLGFSDPDKPIGCFMFTGPTGVGKTQLAKVLAKELFNSEDSLIRIDMSEFSNHHEISKLIGSAPGFVGYKEGGRLTEAVRKNPYSVVLLDEIEKAHKDVFNIFLQVLDDGILTDGLGVTVNFKNTVFIMTSNVGSSKAQEAGDSVGFGTSTKGNYQEQRINSILDSSLKKTFSPEFINRLDAVIRFNYLTPENIKDILTLELTKVKQRIQKLGYTVNLTPEAETFLVEKGFQKNFGARPLKRALQTYVEDFMVNEILDNNLPKKSVLTITHSEGEDTLSKLLKKKEEVTSE